MRRTTTAAALTAILIALSGCSSSGDTTAETKPSASPTPSPTPSYTLEDCVALLEEGYQAGAPRDASNDPECAHLTDAGYTQAVGQVLVGHKDEIMDQAAREIIWDKGWAALDAAGQERVCAQIRDVGVDVVAEQFAALGSEPVGYETEMAQYYLDEKC